MIHIITSFYVLEEKNENSIERNKEIEQSLIKNYQSPNVSNIHLFVDDEKAFDKLKTIIEMSNDKENMKNKIIVVSIGKQPTYGDLFLYACQALKDKIVMIANSDIYLHECDLECLKNISENVFALTRYEHDLSYPLIETMRQKKWASHDAFIFQSPLTKIKLKNFIPKINHYQNTWGSEHIIIDRLIENKYQLFNPCYQIKIVHLHASELRDKDRQRVSHNKYFICPSEYKSIENNLKNAILSTI